MQLLRRPSDNGAAHRGRDAHRENRGPSRVTQVNPLYPRLLSSFVARRRAECESETGTTDVRREGYARVTVTVTVYCLSKRNALFPNEAVGESAAGTKAGGKVLDFDALAAAVVTWTAKEGL